MVNRFNLLSLYVDTVLVNEWLISGNHRLTDASSWLIAASEWFINVEFWQMNGWTMTERPRPAIHSPALAPSCLPICKMRLRLYGSYLGGGPLESGSSWSWSWSCSSWSCQGGQQWAPLQSSQAHRNAFLRDFCRNATESARGCNIIIILITHPNNSKIRNPIPIFDFNQVLVDQCWSPADCQMDVFPISLGAQGSQPSGNLIPGFPCYRVSIVAFDRYSTSWTVIRTVIDDERSSLSRFSWLV